MNDKEPYTTAQFLADVQAGSFEDAVSTVGSLMAKARDLENNLAEAEAKIARLYSDADMAEHESTLMAKLAAAEARIKAVLALRSRPLTPNAYNEHIIAYNQALGDIQVALVHTKTPAVESSSKQ